MLGIHQEIQQKVFEELQTTLSKSTEISTKDINNMKYLECVIKETLRMFPLDPIIGRYAADDIKLGKILMKN